LEYLQNYNPLGNTFASTLAAAVPVVTLLYLLALHPTKTHRGDLHKGIAAHKAASIAVLIALLISIFIFKMPAKTAGMSLIFGAMYGLFPIGWIVIAAMFLYTITVVSGLFEILKDSVASLSNDRRIQAILIAFSFGAFVEGAAGFGTPVAISGALMVGLGFRPLEAAILCLIANTAPVAYGALGTPITALSTVTGMPEMLISRMAARQLPFFSLIVPIWMTAVQVRMDRQPWSKVWEVWPALLVAGGSFAITQFVIGNFINFQLVDILGGVASMAALALFTRFWQPPNTYVHEGHQTVIPRKHPPDLVFRAWLPWALLTVIVFAWGYPPIKSRLEKIPHSVAIWKVNNVHGSVYRTPPVVEKKTLDKAEYRFNWLTAPGTAILISALLTGLLTQLNSQQWRQSVLITASRLRLPLLTICLILSMGFITKYSGMDAVLGLAFTKTGWLYPFFAAMLGWLGVALTGSDTSSNALFGSLQTITARRLVATGVLPLSADQAMVLLASANSTGGVMGKMIDAQSIVVAAAATQQHGQEGPILRFVFWHSVALALLMGMLVMVQAYLWQASIP